MPRMAPRLLALTLCTLTAAMLQLTPVAQAGVARLAVRRVPAPAPTAAAKARALTQMTALTPSQVKVRPAGCAAASRGHVGCSAQELVLRSTGRPVRPLVRREHSFTQVFPTDDQGIDPDTSSGATPPQPGTPAYLQQAYDLSYLSQTAGIGDTIAIVDVGDDPTAESDLATFRSTYGLPACTTANGCFTKVGEYGSTSSLPAQDSGWWPEISLDLDAVSSLCPNCHIILVETNSSSFSDMDQGDIEGAALGASQISDSWSAGGSGTFGGTYTFAHASVIAATGDNGYLGPGVAAYPASLPGVTAAGGTTLTAGSGAGAAARGYSEAAWGGAGAGCNPYYAKPSYQTDSGCTGRAFADVSADANPNTGLGIVLEGGWELLGGTSLATPLVAAYEAVTGVTSTTTTPQWPYTDSALLNDPSSGSDGTCTSDPSYICNAGPGYDGPTGEGSISGDIVTGGPGVAGPTFSGGYVQSLASTSATLTGGVYPNGLATTYYWQYGTTTSYGQQTPAASAGSGQTPSSVSTSLSGLTAGVTYHYRLVGQNADGTTYGYDYTFTTPTQAPVYVSLPTISGTGIQGATLSMTSQGTWSNSPTSFADQWQIATSPTSGWSNISGATGTSYTVTPGDLGATIRMCVTAANSYGTGFKCAIGIGPIVSGAPAYVTLPTISGSGVVGATLSVTSVGSWSNSPTSDAYQWQIATSPTSGWSNISGATGTTYTVAPGDSGATIRMCVTAANAAGTGFKCAIGIGPIQ